MDLLTISFICLGTLAVALAMGVMTRRSPVAAAILLIADFVVLAGMYGLLDAHFAAVTQVIVYAGAIMVVFVFVMMLLNLPVDIIRYGRMTLFEVCFAGAAIACVGGVSRWIHQGALQLGNSETTSYARAPFYSDISQENLRNVAALMFTEYLWAFEIVSFLILAAVVGAVVIAKKKESDHVEPI